MDTSDAGWVDSSWPINWFQQGYGYTGSDGGKSSVVEACVAAYAQTISQLPIRLYRKNPDGGRTLIKSNGESRYSNIARLLHRPNRHQTRTDFMLNLIYGILMDGNGYWYGTGQAYRPDELYLLSPKQTFGHRADTGDVFYSTGGPYTDWAEVPQEAMVPERFVGHVRLFTPTDPLRGVTPLTAAASSIAANTALTGHQAAFFRNMSRPSGFLSTDMDLTSEQMSTLRDRWEEKSKDLNSGGIPILAGGMTYNQMSITSQDAQLVEAWRMSVEDISRVFRVPLPLINSMDNATLNNAETLMNFWLSSGLGFLLRHIEENMEKFFDLGDEYEVEYDTDRLLRSDFKGRIDALGTAVTKGIYSPDEARRKEGLAEVPGGHGKMPRVQQQMVGLDFNAASEQPAPTPEPDDTPAPPEPDDNNPISEAALTAFVDTAWETQHASQ